MPVNRSTLFQDEKEAMRLKAQQVWRSADAVCFDVDSTVISEEGIDKLAGIAGVGKEVSEMTKKAMSGSMTFQDALALRLNIIKPTQAMVTSMRGRDVDQILTPGVRELVAKLQARNVVVYLVSGGFSQLIEPIAEALNIPKDNIYANCLLFNEKGNYVGFDKTRLTCQSGGKPRAVESLKKKFHYKRVVMVGDGATDMEACPPADAFIGFGGNQVREKVKEGAMWFVYSMHDLIAALNEDYVSSSVNGITKPVGAECKGRSNGVVSNGYTNGSLATGPVTNGCSNGTPAVSNGYTNGSLATGAMTNGCSNGTSAVSNGTSAVSNGHTIVQNS